MGSWFPDTPDHCKNGLGFYDLALQQALTSSTANLSDTDFLRHVLVESSGYQILWLLAHAAGHPALSTQSFNMSFPRQKTLSFHEYTQEWLYFFHLEHCRGVTYSDIYFVEQWLEHLSRVFDPIKQLGLAMLRDCFPNQPLPIHMSPEHIVLYLCERAKTIGISNLTPQTTSATYTEAKASRRSTASSTSPATVRQLGSSSLSEPIDVRLLDHFPDELMADVCSLVANSSNQTCDLCNSTSHLVAACPVLAKVIADPYKTRRLISTLEQNRSSRGGYPPTPAPRTHNPTPRRPPPRARTPLSSNRSTERPSAPAPMRAMRYYQDEDTDDDATIAQLTDDDMPTDDDTDDESPDFRWGDVNVLEIHILALFLLQNHLPTVHRRLRRVLVLDPLEPSIRPILQHWDLLLIPCSISTLHPSTILKTPCYPNSLIKLSLMILAVKVILPLMMLPCQIFISPIMLRYPAPMHLP